MKQTFNTSIGTVEVLVDQQSRIVSIYRFDEQHRAIAAAIESWDHVDLLDVLNRQAGVPLGEANRIAATVREQHAGLGSLGERLEQRSRERSGWSNLQNAGIPLRFVAVLLDSLIVFAPLGIFVAVMRGDGYNQHVPAPASTSAARRSCCSPRSASPTTPSARRPPVRRWESAWSASASSARTAST